MTTQHPAVEPAPADPIASAPAPAPAKAGNGLAIAALVLGIVGLVLAFIPLVGGFGGFLGFVGLVLGVVALFLKGRKKGLAIAGAAVSALALIVSIVMGLVYTAMFVSSVDQAINQPVTVDPVEGAEEEAPAGDEAAGEAGTRENPVAVGSVISGTEYDVVINSVTLNATDQVLAASPVNDAPADGLAYAIINASITYTGEESGYAAMAMIDFVADSGEVYDSSDNFAVAPDPSLGLDELFTGGVATGNTVIAIPADAQGVLRVQPGLFADEIFVAVQ